LTPLGDLTTGACRAVIQDYEGLGDLHNLYPKIVNSMGQQIFMSGAAMLMDINSGFMKNYFVIQEAHKLFRYSGW
jgi:hypothetical protein